MQLPRCQGTKETIIGKGFWEQHLCGNYKLKQHCLVNFPLLLVLADWLVRRVMTLTGQFFLGNSTNKRAGSNFATLWWFRCIVCGYHLNTCFISILAWKYWNQMSLMWFFALEIWNDVNKCESRCGIWITSNFYSCTFF